MSDDDDKVRPIPVKFRKPTEDDPPFLSVVSRWNVDCNHRDYYENNRTHNVGYLLREGETEIECGRCHARLDPMFVLRILAHEETSWKRAREHYVLDMKRLSERSRTKCDHCGKMTRISR